MAKTHSTTFSRADETEVTVEYTISPYDPGVTSGPAENCYPPEGGEVEIIKITDAEGNKIGVSEDEFEMWIVRIAENHDFSADYGDDY